MTKVTEKNLPELSREGTVMLEFSARWCGPCRKQKSIIDKIATDIDDVTFGDVDIEEEGGLTSKFKVQSVPTIVVLRDGLEVDRLEGLQQPDKLLAALA